MTQPTQQTTTTVSTANAPRSTRRSWLKRSFYTGTALLTGGIGYAAIEAGWITLEQVTIHDPRFPTAWHGLRIVQLTDLHHGPVTGLPYIERVVKLANELEPDLILLTGDNSHRGQQYVLPCFEVLQQLRAKLGVFSVPGNHDYYQLFENYYQGVQLAGFKDLTNQNIQLTRGQQSLYLVGCDDYMRGRPNVIRATAGMPRDAAAIMLCHNPDVVDSVTDQRIRLTLCGHTHGGQINLPLYGPPIMPYGYRSHYLSGLYTTPSQAQVYVSRGLGTIIPPLRFRTPPEVTLLTLEG